MRLRVEFAESLVTPLLRKSWVSVPAHFHLVSDLYAYLIKSFELSQTEDAICLSLDDHYLPRNQRLFDIVRDNDLIVVTPVAKQTAPAVVQTPNAAAFRPKPPPALKRKAVSSSSDSEDPPPQKRPAPKADAGNRKNPRLTEFKGTHIKFDSEGSAHVVTDKPVIDLKVKSPSQEFDEKKAGWKTKPFPKRAKREPEISIKEVYEYDVQQYSPADPSSLTAGQEVLFKTLELSEEKMVPVVSDFKVQSTQRAKVNWVNDSLVNVSLLREVSAEEKEMLQNAEVIDDSLIEKYYLTVEKAKMGDLRVKKEQ